MISYKHYVLAALPPFEDSWRRHKLPVPPDFTKRYWFATVNDSAGGSNYGFLNDVQATCDNLEELKYLYDSSNDTWWIPVMWDNGTFKEVKKEELDNLVSADFSLMLNKAIEQHPDDFKSFDTTTIFMTEQLQDIVKSNRSNKSIKWLTKKLKELDVCITKRDMRYEKGSLDRFWLSFLMEDKFGEIWDGKEWVK